MMMPLPRGEPRHYNAKTIALAAFAVSATFFSACPGYFRYYRQLAASPFTADFYYFSTAAGAPAYAHKKKDDYRDIFMRAAMR